MNISTKEAAENVVRNLTELGATHNDLIEVAIALIKAAQDKLKKEGLK